MLETRKVKKGKKVTVNHFLTTDPFNKRGKTGIVITINRKEDWCKVKFEDGTIGCYELDCFE